MRICDVANWVLMIHRIIKNSQKGANNVVPVDGEDAPQQGAPKRAKKPLRRGLLIALEAVIGLFVLCGVLVALLYMRLEKGNIDLAFLVPSIENAINEQLTDLSVHIESAFLGQNRNNRGIHFRLRNLVLYNKQGEAIANAPLAAVGLNGAALLWGKVAPRQVVFIKPTLDIVQNEGGGLSLSYARAEQPEKTKQEKPPEDVIADLLSGLAPDAARANHPSLEETFQQLRQVDFMKAVTAAFEEARNHRNGSSYLTQFGVRDAVINYTQDKVKYSWDVADFVLDLKHSETGSSIRGFGHVALAGNDENAASPWKLRFQAHQTEKTKGLRLDMGFADVTPASLRTFIPQLKQVKVSDIPFDGKITAQISKDGVVSHVFANLSFAAGKFSIPGLEGGDFVVDKGELKFAYDRQSGKLHILPSLLSWGSNQTVVSGILQPVSDEGLLGKWKFSVRGDETRLGAADFGLKPIIVEEWWATGAFAPKEELLEVGGVYLRTGNATIRLQGRVEQALSTPGVYMSGEIGTISMPVLKRIWPSFIAPDTREWLGERVLDGRIIGGDVQIALPPGVLNKLAEGGDIAPEMVSLKLELGDLVVLYLDDLVPANLPGASLKVSGRQFSVTMPKGYVEVKGYKPIRLSHGSFAISDLREDIPHADMDFRIAGTAPGMLAFINQPTLKFADEAGVDANDIKGKIKGLMAMSMPLKKGMEIEDVAVKGNLRLTGLRISKKLSGGVPVTGGSLNISLTEKGMGVEGGIVVRKIPARLQWQRIFGRSNGKQPPIRLSTVLGKTDRKKLGLGKLNKTVKGDVPVVVTLFQRKNRKPTIQVRADLTNARIITGPVGWKKQPGSVAVLQFDMKKLRRNRVLLSNLSLVGKEIFLEGKVTINEKDGLLQSFSFPKVTYQLTNTMKVSGKRDRQGVLSIVATVKSLDGRKILRPMMFANGEKKTGEKSGANRGRSDLDLVANIETIIGDQGVTIRNTRLEVRKRKGVVEWVNFKGKINGASLFALRLEREDDGRRYLKVESGDAGGVLRLLGLFPNVEKGQLSLKVDMDQKGATEKSGTLWVKNFSVISSQTIDSGASGNEVFSGFIGDAGKKRRRRGGRVRKIKTSMQFDRLKAPFIYGEGQLILHDTYVNGPMVGATLRGTIDFRARKVRLGGTYVPLYGLNAAVGEIPVLRELLVGRQGEGVFGVTFAIQGELARPLMIVNPVSLLTPGVFRQIFDFNNNVSNREIRKRIRQRQRGGPPVMQ